MSRGKRKAAKRQAARRKKQAARKARARHEAKERARAARPSPGSIFRERRLPLGSVAGSSATSESPPAQLIAVALLALVIAAASFLMLTARLSREWRV